MKSFTMEISRRAEQRGEFNDALESAWYVLRTEQGRNGSNLAAGSDAPMWEKWGIFQRDPEARSQNFGPSDGFFPQAHVDLDDFLKYWNVECCDIPLFKGLVAGLPLIWAER
jgi:hypothetical protein